MSDTPKTDAFVAGPGWTIARTSAEHFARTLERELNAAHDLLRQADDKLTEYDNDVLKLAQKVQQLERDNARLLALATEATSAT